MTGASHACNKPHITDINQPQCGPSAPALAGADPVKRKIGHGRRLAFSNEAGRPPYVNHLCPMACGIC
ncbi:hypothetical protein ARTHRO9AX_150105 [Arthrobacter sp. 9AX]|nr:hypothetical protein ARTHRO9AX_150105 [Arthrobacter sp. 9AX]